MRVYHACCGNLEMKSDIGNKGGAQGFNHNYCMIIKKGCPYHKKL